VITVNRDHQNPILLLLEIAVNHRIHLLHRAVEVVVGLGHQVVVAAVEEVHLRLRQVVRNGNY
jgi:hypothetical protein